jgi:hypothetical protein
MSETHEPSEHDASRPDIAGLAQALAGGLDVQFVPEDYSGEVVHQALSTAGPQRAAALDNQRYLVEHPYER